MKIYKLEIENFRLLKDFTLDLEDELSLVIGKNNTGKTSILSILDKFLNEKSKFSFDDLNIEYKKELKRLINADELEEDYTSSGIKLKIYIEYNEADNLSNVSQVLMDLDPKNNIIVLGFEYSLYLKDLKTLRQDYKEFLKNETTKKNTNSEYILKELNDFLKREISKYFKQKKFSFEYDIENKKVNEVNFVNLDNENISIKDIINFKYISARRDVTNKEEDYTLSKQTSNLYKKQEDNSKKTKATEDFKDKLSETDSTLSIIYEELFEGVIRKVKDFGGINFNDSNISIISSLQHRNLLEGNTTVIYTHDDYNMPENYNGLGYMNLISMIFEIEILIQEFKRNKDGFPSDINLLFIEEPEAHTHPQMQYIFIKNIKKLLGKGIENSEGNERRLQYIITTHSSHIVADSDFDDIKYLKVKSKNSVIAKNLKTLIQEYKQETKQYQFLRQYLTISRAEIFFAEKTILIEGDTERILLPTIMRKLDIEENDEFLPLLSQNISIIEVGAYSQIFQKFIDFLGIKALILTDIDSVKVCGQDKNGKDIYGACRVAEGTKTSNSAINHFLKERSWEEIKTLSFEQRCITYEGSAEYNVCYQQVENNYHSRSFEDAFICINRKFLNDNKEEFQGLKNSKYLNDEYDDYDLAEKCIKKKTHFALDILYNSDEEYSNWNIPGYIKVGLLWLKKGKN